MRNRMGLQWGFTLGDISTVALRRLPFGMARDTRPGLGAIAPGVTAVMATSSGSRSNKTGICQVGTGLECPGQVTNVAYQAARYEPGAAPPPGMIKLPAPRHGLWPIADHPAVAVVHVAAAVSGNVTQRLGRDLWLFSCGAEGAYGQPRIARLWRQALCGRQSGPYAAATEPMSMKDVALKLLRTGRWTSRTPSFCGRWPNE